MTPVPTGLRGRSSGAGVALALQGGGAHGAFVWGVLDRLLAGGLVPDAIRGVSAHLPPSVRLTSYDDDGLLADLPISSKFNGEAAFIDELFAAGRAAAMRRLPASMTAATA